MFNDTRFYKQCRKLKQTQLGSCLKWPVRQKKKKKKKKKKSEKPESRIQARIGKLSTSIHYPVSTKRKKVRACAEKVLLNEIAHFVILRFTTEQ